ncbi:MAG: methyltransferase domain-containing protein [Rhodospirillaceae bacterium]|nr:methyltransferase domain-containing protein [Rhodospirillaceae bacterium]MBT4589977.1 methyltransferase domain-containing protein [Rhodospirillaceae bacterium]MBT4938733.1 methyltransferase domain-containing protein [Rhodospirillaceae bacterium]MBT5938581.1 methyltransferase domain-containing protein [Rhodospirillaceae bacterium]MBT7265309.1 methyltransferase domain-containing protein [Rhodospirillaceae bacterium]
MKLNLGCGNNKLEGYLNVDSQQLCAPDQVVDLEVFPWPFEDNSVDEIVMSHVLEHLGETKEVYLAIIKELYRICQADAEIRINVPHPRHDEFIIDPTHVRPILPEQFHLFSKRLNAEWREAGYANTPLADYIDVDFEVEDVQWVLADDMLEKLQSGEISSDDLATRAQHEYNILKEIQIKLRVVK